MEAPPEPTWPAVLTRWSVEPAAVVLLALAGVAYLRGRSATPGGGQSRPGRFGAGLGVVAVALLSPVSTYAGALLTAHMVQHLLLAFVAAPLLVSSRAGPAVADGLPAPLALRLRRVATGRAWRHLTSPVVAWTIFAASGWLVHFTGLFDLALRQPVVHAGEHLLFLGAGLLFWLPVVGGGPSSIRSYPARLGYLALGMPQNTFLALALYSAGRPLYESYEQLARAWGPSVLADQRAGAGIMWVAGDLTLLAAVLAVAARWASEEMRAASGE